MKTLSATTTEDERPPEKRAKSTSLDNIPACPIVTSRQTEKGQYVDEESN